jgi:hypothetical protein
MSVDAEESVAVNPHFTTSADPFCPVILDMTMPSWAVMKLWPSYGGRVCRCPS